MIWLITSINRGKTDIKIKIIFIEKITIITINTEIKKGIQLHLAIAWREITPKEAEVKAESHFLRKKEKKNKITRRIFNIFWLIKKFKIAKKEITTEIPKKVLPDPHLEVKTKKIKRKKIRVKPKIKLIRVI